MARQVLPQRRYSESFDWSHAGIRYAGQVGFFPDGRIGEVFLGMEKAAGTAMDVVARDAAVLISLGLQFGVELEHMLHSVTKDENGEPEGLIGFLIAFLLHYEPKADGWGAPRVIEDQGGAEVAAVAHVPSPVEPHATFTQSEAARRMGFTGSQCSACGSMQMKVSGHCEVCNECGTTTGCS